MRILFREVRKGPNLARKCYVDIGPGNHLEKYPLEQNLTENGSADSMLAMEADSSQGSSASSVQGFSILAVIFQLPCCLVIIFHVSKYRRV